MAYIITTLQNRYSIIIKKTNQLTHYTSQDIVHHHHHKKNNNITLKVDHAHAHPLTIKLKTALMLHFIYTEWASFGFITAAYSIPIGQTAQTYFSMAFTSNLHDQLTTNLHPCTVAEKPRCTENQIVIETVRTSHGPHNRHLCNPKQRLAFWTCKDPAALTDKHRAERHTTQQNDLEKPAWTGLTGCSPSSLCI